MRKSWLFMLVSVLAVGWMFSSDATIIKVGKPVRITTTSRQPLEVVIINSYGKVDRQTGYYNPVSGEIDIDTSWAGPNASIYIPTLDVSYIWYNGYWVDENGYFWDGGRRAYVTYPDWKNYWSGYWHRYGRDWNRRWYDGWRRERDYHDGEHRDGWRGRDRDWQHDRNDRWHTQDRGSEKRSERAESPERKNNR